MRKRTKKSVLFRKRNENGIVIVHVPLFFLNGGSVLFRQVRDECLSHIRSTLEEKERELKGQIESLRTQLANPNLLPEDVRSKKFFLNVVENRLKRQKTQGMKFYSNAEHRVKSDPRLARFF